MVNATPLLLYPRERPYAHCIGGWVDLRAIGRTSIARRKYYQDRILLTHLSVDPLFGWSGLVGRYHSLSILLLLKYAAFGDFLN